MHFLVVWAPTAHCMHVRLLELAYMTEIDSAGWVRVAHACLRVKAHGEQHLLQHIENKVKQLKHTFATYVYNHCNIYNIHIEHLQHTYETGETFRTYTCNICNIQMKA
jgi:hypothetical protein